MKIIKIVRKIISEARKYSICGGTRQVENKKKEENQVSERRKYIQKGSEMEEKEYILCVMPSVSQGDSGKQQAKRTSRKNRTSKRDSEAIRTVSECPKSSKNHEKS